jgi:hypothetical protein
VEAQFHSECPKTRRSASPCRRGRSTRAASPRSRVRGPDALSAASGGGMARGTTDAIDVYLKCRRFPRPCCAARPPPISRRIRRTRWDRLQLRPPSAEAIGTSSEKTEERHVDLQLKDIAQIGAPARQWSATRSRQSNPSAPLLCALFSIFRRRSAQRLTATSTPQGHQVICEFARAMQDRTRKLPPFPGIFRGYAALILRNHPTERELTLALWGMPSPDFALKAKCPPDNLPFLSRYRLT